VEIFAFEQLPNANSIRCLPCSDTSSPGNNRGRCSGLLGQLQSPFDAFDAPAQVGYLFGAGARQQGIDQPQSLLRRQCEGLL
jgi:hypothetical protein